MPYYRSVGHIPRKRHARHPKPGGGLYAEELMGIEGFSAESSLLYHLHLPTAITSAEPVELGGAAGFSSGAAGAADGVSGADGDGALARASDAAGAGADGLVPNRPLLPRHFRLHDLPESADAVTGRHLLLANDDVRISYVRTRGTGELYRNAVGDELVYVESGTATLETVFGALDLRAGDYAVVPTSTTHRLVPGGDEEVALLVVEAGGHIRPPSRYLSSTGQFLEHAPYSERDLRSPATPLVVDAGAAGVGGNGVGVAETGSDGAGAAGTPVLVRHRGGLTRYTYLHQPFDVVGWDGCLYPYAFSIHDFEPIVKRFHAPPPVHQTFEGPGFVVCSFCPRPYDFDPEAVAVPYNHANVDSDEVLFYVGGDFMSRKGAGIGRGSVSLHPAGFVHGPQPGSVEAAFGQPGTDELAVMIDTFRPLQLGRAAASCEDPAYAWTWAEGVRRQTSPSA